MQQLAPVQSAEREIFMDVLRGFAILGILILQVIISTTWLKFFNYSPIEWV
jgi:uncharacterized membrane protein YeiB